MSLVFFGIFWQSPILQLFSFCSSLYWVSPEMLGVPFPDKKTAASGDPFLPAITGEFQRVETFSHNHLISLMSLKYLC